MLLFLYMALAVFFDYVTWLYSSGIREYFRAWANFHWFIFHFFSLNIMVRTFFVPWHRMREQGGRGLDIEGALARLAVNSILRIVGMIIRVSLIISAVIFEVTLFVAAFLVFVIFMLSPALIPLFIMSGIMLFAI